MKLRDIAKYMMFTYPLSYSSMLEVFSNIFLLNGGSFYWNKDGEMDISDEDIVEIPEKIDLSAFGYKNGNDTLHLRDQALALKAQFIQVHFDELFDSYSIGDMFSISDMFSSSQRSMTSRMDTFRIGVLDFNNKSNLFSYPDNITKEYGDAIIKFINHWHVALNYKYGISNQTNFDEAIAHWPNDIKELKCQLSSVSDDIHFKLGYGTRQEREALAKRLIDEVLKEKC